MPATINYDLALVLLRNIVAAEDEFFDKNDSGPQEAFQAAADSFHDAIHVARMWLETNDKDCPPSP